MTIFSKISCGMAHPGFRLKPLASASFMAMSGFAASLLLLPNQAAAFSQGDQVPSVVQQIPSGSQADASTKATFDGQYWTVVFTRKLNTGDTEHDIQFAAGGTYFFQVATFDNASGMAQTSSHKSDSLNPYTMTIPATPGALTFSATPPKLAAISGQLLSTSQIQITLKWEDTTQNDFLGPWTYNYDKRKRKGTWVAPDPSTLEQDSVALIWDMQNDGFTTSGTCEQMCHGFEMKTTAGKVDEWLWEAASTGPIAHAEEGYWDMTGIHEDPGLTSYMENELVNGHPKYYPESAPLASTAKRLFLLQKGTREAAKPALFPDSGWVPGNVLPGSVARPAVGPLGDVVTTSYHDGSQWTVTFRRKLNTGGDDGHDITFEKGKSYSFLYTHHDNADDDIGNGVYHTMTDPSTPFTMQIPDVPGPLNFPTVPGQISAISGKLLDSDEIEITVSWPDETRNDNKRQWQYNPVNPATPWIRVSNDVNSSDKSSRTFSSDRFTFLWDTIGDGFTTAGNCQEMCHSGEGAMRTKAGTIEAWTWTGSASATGYAKDEYWDDNSGAGNGLNKSDGGSQTSTTTNTAYKADGSTTTATADIVASKLTYTTMAGAGTSGEFLYYDASQGTDWVRGVPSFVQSITKVAVLSKKAGRGALQVSGTYDDNGVGLGLPDAGVHFALGTWLDVTIPRNSFKSVAKGKQFAYMDKQKHVTMTFDTRKKTFLISATRQDLTAVGSAKSGEFDLDVGQHGGRPRVSWR